MTAAETVLSLVDAVISQRAQHPRRATADRPLERSNCATLST